MNFRIFIFFFNFFTLSFCKVEHEDKNQKFSIEIARQRLDDLTKVFEDLQKSEKDLERLGEDIKNAKKFKRKNKDESKKENDYYNYKNIDSFESLLEVYKDYTKKVETLYTQINDYITKPTETITKEMHALLKEALMLKLESGEHLNELMNKKNGDL